MAKLQTRRTVSIGADNYTRLVEYARANNASASQVTEYALDTRFAEPIDSRVPTKRQSRACRPR